MPVRARRHIRRMRGGAQAHLIEADDGACYVVKFKNNPQHRRILVNEWIASAFLRYLQLTAPETAIVEIDEEFLQQYPAACIQTGSRTVPAQSGRHFGSRFPGDPARLAVFDFLPDVLLTKVANLADYAGVFVFDKWIGNSDSRQSVFYRARLAEQEQQRAGFVALMVDQGYAFDGPQWTFVDSPIYGFYFRPAVYQGVRGWNAFEPWLERILHFPEEVIDAACKQVPSEWIAEDHQALQSLLERLFSRRNRVARLIEEARDHQPARFPNWK